jgi:hypothetical protein
MHTPNVKTNSAPPTKVRHVEQSLFPDIAPDKPVGPILPSVFTGSNADLMHAVAPYYLTGSVCDLTYGEGKWWDRFKPEQFTAHDKYKLDGVDFTNLPEADNTYDTVVFDPPYVASGGESKTLGDFQHAYGIGSSRIDGGNSGLGEPITSGMVEAVRVSRKWVLVKCMEFAQGGGLSADFKDIPYDITTTAKALGCWKHDQIVHHTGTGPGGHNIFDPKRARRHHSYLIVFRKAAT